MKREKMAFEIFSAARVLGQAAASEAVTCPVLSSIMLINMFSLD
jgi:hypothetical protein